MDFLDDELPKKTKAPLITGIIIGAIILSLTGYFFLRYRQAQKLLANPTEAAKKEQQEIVKKVMSLVEVPTGEEPTVATIADIDKLKDKSFFTSAQNGDKVLVYTSAKKAILYRPSTGKVVEMMVLNQAASAGPAPTTVPQVAGAAAAVIEPTAVPTAAVAKPATVTVLNGTRIAGLAAKAETFITSNSRDFTITTTGNAQNRSQEKTIIVDISGTNTKGAGDLATLIGGTVAKLPGGEIEPSTDLLLILGTDVNLN